MSDPAEHLAKLHADSRIPPADQVGKLPRGGVQLDYLGHAAVTDILLAHDPLWNWEPIAWTDNGLPGVVKDKDGWPVGMWIRLTVHGVSRLGYGSCDPGKYEPIKELIGDALRNAAMRFGVGLSLWAKEEWQDFGVEAGAAESQPQKRTQTRPRGSAKKDNASGAGTNVSTLPTPSDDDVARHPAAGNREPLLPIDQALAKHAADLGLDDDVRKDIILAITKGRTNSGKDLESHERIWVANAYDDVANGSVELRYDPDGTPRIGRPRQLQLGNNPGPPDDEPF